MLCSSKGGCWFCNQTQAPMYRSEVLNAFVHLECVQKAYENAPTIEDIKEVADEFETEIFAETAP